MKFSEVLKTSNVDALLTEHESDKLGREVVEGYLTDLKSRSEWEKRTKEANKLALQVMEPKTFPFEGASNVKFPLLTVATLQFSARAYGALVRAPDIVRCRVVGMDPQGQKKSRADRISQHMSYQVLEQDENWEEEHDKLLMTVPIVGCSFVKSWYDPDRKQNCSEHVSAWDLVLNYYATSVENCERKTHRFYLFDREIRERQLTGFYADKDLGWGEALPEDDLTGSDERQGLEPPHEGGKKPRLILEQHCYLDLDKDGYEEPYVVTVLKDTGKVLRIVKRFEKVITEQSRKIEALQKKAFETRDDTVRDSILMQIRALKDEEPDVLRIEAQEFFTKYDFIPSPDGGIYGLGFGQLLGPINEAVNTLINQLVDSGSLQNQSSGFIGRGARMKGGQLRFKFGEWKKVDVTGSTLKENIVPLPLNPPSPVLFQMLGLLVTYGEKVASVTEIMMGENPGQNTPAYNAQMMMGQGMAVFQGIFKRLYRSMRDEFRKLYKLNRRYLDDMEYFRVLDGPTLNVFKIDYQGDPTDVVPAADVNNVLSEERIRQAAFLAERSRMVPGYNVAATERRLLEAMAVRDLNEIFPVDEKGRPAIPPPPNPEMEIKRMEEQRRALEARTREDLGRRELLIKAEEAAAKVEQLKAEAVKTLAEAGSVDAELSLKRFEAIFDSINEAKKLNIEEKKVGQNNGSAMAGASGN